MRIPIKEAIKRVAEDLQEGGWNRDEQVEVLSTTSLRELLGLMETYGFSRNEAQEFVLNALVDDTRCYVCGRSESKHVDSDYDAEGMCTRTDLKETK